MIVEVFKKGPYTNWNSLIFGCKPFFSKPENIDRCGMKVWTYCYAWLNNYGGKNLVEGIDFNGDYDFKMFDGYVYGKHHHTPFPLNKVFCANIIFELVHTILCGPMMTTSHGKTNVFKHLLIFFMKALL